jgi:hypothetical protein
MKKCDIIFRVLCYSLTGLILLDGCTAPQPPAPTAMQPFSTNVSPIALSSPAITIVPTYTPSPKNTIVPTSTHWPSVTPRPTKTPRPIPTVTWTPLPTLPPDKALARVLELLKTNGGCKLPCWWGITPGVTSRDEALAYLASFATRFTGGPSYPDYGAVFVIPQNTIPGLLYGDPYSFGFTADKNGIVEQITAWKPYRLSDLLTDYGPPPQVWIYGKSTDLLGPNAEYTIVLFYPDKGILAAWWNYKAEKNDPIRVCPNRFDPGVFLKLWAPPVTKTFEEAAGPELLDGPPPLAFYPLEKATNLDVKTFYERYKDLHNASTCFEMPDPLLHPPN